MKLAEKILFIIIFLLPIISFSQSISRFAFSSASGLYSKNICIDFSVGQTVVKVFRNNKILTSGFEQATDLKSSKKIKKNIVNTDSKISIFPNPTSDFAYIYITSKLKIKELKLRIFSAEGKEIFVRSEPYNYEHFYKIQLDLSKLVHGNYILKIYINNSYTNSFTVVKL